MAQTSIRDLFLRYQAQTSPEPIALHIELAQGVNLTDADGKTYLDLISGISVSSLGHSHPDVVKAIQKQSEKYLHLMVYGELAQTPAALYAQALANSLPETLNCVYFVNSGTEAVEGAMKLAKRVTHKHQFVAFKGAYHGSTQGALSLMDAPEFQDPFRPLLPGVSFGHFNDVTSIQLITPETAAVFVEPIQSESGYNPATKEFLSALRNACNAQGALLVFDEIQCGMGRTGSLWAFEQYGVEPDILLTAKALGAGLPLGAFISSRKHMLSLSHNPVLGHITTFGGNALCCAAGLAGFEVLTSGNLIQSIDKKQHHFISQLKHPKIKAVTGKGLMLALDLGTWEHNQKVIQYCLNKGVLTDWFLHAPHKLRLAPPLVISKEEIDFSCSIILEGLNQLN